MLDDDDQCYWQIVERPLFVNVEMTSWNRWYQNSADIGVGLVDPCDSGQIMFSDICLSVESVTCCYRDRIEDCMFFFLGSPMWLN